MPYIDEAYLQNAYGAAQVTALCPTANELNTTIEQAETAVHSAVVMAGYQASAPGDFATVSVAPPVLVLAAYGAWLELAHIRMGKELPDAALAYARKVGQIQSGALEIIGRDGLPVSKTTARAVGGVTSTDTTSTVANGGRAATFTRKAMEGY